MEQLNSVHLRGTVVSTRVQEIGNTRMAHLCVATDYAYKNRSGGAVIETTCHHVVAFESDRMPYFSTLEKGAGIEVKGRIRTQRHTDPSGVERLSTEILASQIGILKATAR